MLYHAAPGIAGNGVESAFLTAAERRFGMEGMNELPAISA
jgi:hypothetical protein